jgi:uncharacterized protein YdiU (UPF0061 family)
MRDYRSLRPGKSNTGSDPRLAKLNLELARSLKLDPHALASDQGMQFLAGNRVAEGSEPLALAYAGHQFGYFVPQLGDGRANLLGEVMGPDGVRYDIQLKGSGPTPFSRRGGSAESVLYCPRSAHGSPSKSWSPYRVTMGSRPAYDVLGWLLRKGRY